MSNVVSFKKRQSEFIIKNMNGKVLPKSMEEIAKPFLEVMETTVSSGLQTIISCDVDIEDSKSILFNMILTITYPNVIDVKLEYIGTVPTDKKMDLCIDQKDPNKKQSNRLVKIFNDYFAA